MEADELPPRRPEPYRWQDDAACRDADPALFFPAQGESTREAKALCAVCPVREQCLDAGLSEGFGIWGGQSERARRRIRAARARRGDFPERQCPHCGKTFQPTTERQKYDIVECSNAAAKRAHRARKRETAKYGPTPEPGEARSERAEQYRQWIAS